MKILIISNGRWASITEKISKIEEFFSPIVDLKIDLKFTDFRAVPFVKRTAIGKDLKVFEATIIDSDWFDKNLIPLGAFYDAILFQTEGNPSPTMSGARTDNNNGPIKLEVYSKEYDRVYQNGKDMGDAFVKWSCHEICHMLAMMAYQNEPNK